jgi:tetratricopeptide (TPR) repeat protein
LLAAATALLFAASNLQPLAPALAPIASSGEVPGLHMDLALQRHRLNDEAVNLNAAGEFERAVERLYTAIDSAPREQVLYGNLVTVLRNWAVAEINAGRPAEAIGHLLEALDVREDPALLALLGIAQERIGDHHNASENLNRALELGSTDPMAYVALGRIHRQQGDQQRAVAMLQRARGLGASGSDFDRMLARLERELDAEWDFVDFDTAHFRISFAQGENPEAAEIVSQHLEDAYFAVGRKLDFYPDTPTDVVLYASEDFHNVTQTPDWTGGVYDGRIKLPVRGIHGASELLQRTLRHEYGHVLITKLSNGRAPVWLNEGLAIWAEEQSDGDRENWAYSTISGQHLFTLEELVAPFTQLPADRVQVAYAQSYLAVRQILTEHGDRHVLALLEEIGSGASISSAFESELATTIARFQAQLIRDLTS